MLDGYFDDVAHRLVKDTKFTGEPAGDLKQLDVPPAPQARVVPVLQPLLNQANQHPALNQHFIGLPLENCLLLKAKFTHFTHLRHPCEEFS